MNAVRHKNPSDSVLLRERSNANRLLLTPRKRVISVFDQVGSIFRIPMPIRAGEFPRRDPFHANSRPISSVECISHSDGAILSGTAAAIRLTRIEINPKE